MKVMADLGVSASAIGKRIGSSHNTVIKYLRSEVYNDPSINKLVEFIKEKELADLYLLGAKGRTRLHELMDDGKSKMIETIALVDRTFQQRRLLEGQSTQNIATLSKLIEAVQDAGDKSLRTRVLTD
jgi:transcriptional regulator with XRE-family HTH domain